MDHLILCIEKEHDQILALGSGGEDGVANRRWLAAEVLRAIADGDRFYLLSPNTGSEADLELRDGELACAHDEVGEECLHALRSCRWR